MDSQPYTYVKIEMLKEAVAPYEEWKIWMSKEKNFLQKLILIKNQCDEVIQKLILMQTQIRLRYNLGVKSFHFQKQL
jgi:hypothetical protein